MEPQEYWRSTFSSLHVITVLTDLAQLSQQDRVLSSSSFEPSAFASTLLIHLISLRQANQRAFFSAFPSHHVSQRQLATATVADAALFPLVVCHQMSEESVQAALSHSLETRNPCTPSARSLMVGIGYLLSAPEADTHKQHGE